MTRLFKILISEKGSAFIEYALWIALFVLVVAVAVSQLECHNRRYSRHDNQDQF